MMNTPVTAQYRVEYLSTGVSIDELRVVLMYILSILLIDWKQMSHVSRKSVLTWRLHCDKYFPPILLWILQI